MKRPGVTCRCTRSLSSKSQQSHITQTSPVLPSPPSTSGCCRARERLCVCPAMPLRSFGSSSDHCNGARRAQAGGLIWPEQKALGHLALGLGMMDGKSKDHAGSQVPQQASPLRSAPSLPVTGTTVAVARGYSQPTAGRTGLCRAAGCWGGFPVIAGASLCWSSWAYLPVCLPREVFNCCLGAVVDRNPMANCPLSACRCWHRATEGRHQRGRVRRRWLCFSPFAPERGCTSR